MAQLSFILGSEGELSGEGLAPAGEGTMFWSGGSARLTSGGDWIELRGGVQEHLAKGLNQVGYPANCQTLLVNLLTPFDRTFEIRLSPVDGDGAGSAADAANPEKAVDGEAIR